MSDFDSDFAEAAADLLEVFGRQVRWRPSADADWTTLTAKVALMATGLKGGHEDAVVRTDEGERHVEVRWLTAMADPEHALGGVARPAMRSQFECEGAIWTVEKEYGAGAWNHFMVEKATTLERTRPAYRGKR